VNEFPEPENNSPDQSAGAAYPPKPQVAERKQNALVRSLVSLFIYGLLFYFLFDRNIAYIAAILLVIVIHESGHFAFMKLFNYANVKIFIVPLLGAFTSGRKQKISQLQLCLIILGGPVPGIIIGSVIFWYNLQVNDRTLTMLANSFLIINLLNCLPFYPLDGGRLIETLFFKENHIIRLIFGIISVMALLLLFLLSMSPVLLIIPALIALELYNENKHQKIRDYLRMEGISYRTDYAHLPDKDYWLMRDCLILSFPKKYASIQAGKYEYSMLEPLFIQHINSVLQVDLISDLNGFKKFFMVLFYIIIFVAPVIFVVLNYKSAT
jgi:Zn-dependent protease